MVDFSSAPFFLQLLKQVFPAREGKILRPEENCRKRRRKRAGQKSLVSRPISMLGFERYIRNAKIEFRTVERSEFRLFQNIHRVVDFVVQCGPFIVQSLSRCLKIFFLFLGAKLPHAGGRSVETLRCSP